MAETTVRIEGQTWVTLQGLACEMDEPVEDVLAKALEFYRRQRIADLTNAGYTKGDPWRPEPMTDEELAHKFRSYADGILGRENVDQAITQVLDSDAAPNVANLMKVVGRGKAP